MYKIIKTDSSVVLSNGNKLLRLVFINEKIVKITYTTNENFLDKQSLIVENQTLFNDFTVIEDEEIFLFKTSKLKITVNKMNGAISYFNDSNNLIIKEPSGGGKWLTSVDVYKNIFDGSKCINLVDSIDGAKVAADEYQAVFDRKAFHAKVEFEFDEKEAIFGLGSHEEGYGNLRGKSRQLYQQNMKAVVPYFVSTKGYGFLFDCCSLMTFEDSANGSYIWCDVVDELDYYFIYGENFDEVTKGYHVLTGKAPMLPKWAFGYAQSKERYETADEMINVVNEYRKRGIPLDCIILDWQSWPEGGGWGQKTLDEKRFPNPKRFTQDLHDLNAKLMVSIWPIMTGNCPNQVEMLEKNFMLGNQSNYNAFDKNARDCYWEQTDKGLFSNGVDAWWCDCSEPFEDDWCGEVKPEPHQRVVINVNKAKQYIDSGYISAYSLQHSRGIYEGQRNKSEEKRVVNLTRSSYAGQHRYSTITWSGDISATWETLKRSVIEGVNFCASGEPYWTIDIGAFFVKNNPNLWFWNGDYDDGCKDLGYCELYTRWLQYGAFLPMFRSHGTDTPREIWNFGEEGSMFYDAIAKYIKLRYQLIPYIYSLAAQITQNSYTLMRAVPFDFPNDIKTYDLLDQYMFGSALMICPVLKPMYYDKKSKPIVLNEKIRKVYLPEGASWYDYWTNQLYEGGQTIEANASIETIPIFVKSGSIVPMSPVMQYTDEISNAPYEIKIYGGKDVKFTIYEDEGDNYNYENGAYSIIDLKWDNKNCQLTIGDRVGQFKGMIGKREFIIQLISQEKINEKHVLYCGNIIQISF